MLASKMSRPFGLSSFNRARTIAGLMGLTFVLGGCVGGPDAKSVLTPVPSDLTTGSIPIPKSGSDEASDGQAVSAAAGAPAHLDAETDEIPWANPATGTTGVISRISQSEVGGRTCRAFVTSRHSYSGIALYFGQTCLGPDGQWQMIRFQPKDAIDATVGPASQTSDDG